MPNACDGEVNASFFFFEIINFIRKYANVEALFAFVFFSI